MTPDNLPLSPQRSERQEIGREGEDRACRILEEKKWAILARNWRTRRGEIDIIGIDRDAIVFVEVKTWPHGDASDLEYVIGRTKRKRMVETAKCFLNANRQYSGMYVRFDVVLIVSDPRGAGKPRYRHLEDAIAERVG